MTATFDFVEIRTRDLERSQAFYSAVFGWKIESYPMETPGAMASTGAMPMVGLMQFPESVPLSVVPYVTVEDCEAAAQRAVELGATLIMGKQAVEEMGWFTDVVDPWGNEVGFWQERHPERELDASNLGPRQNPVCWVELLSTQQEAAVSFWKQVVGWSFRAEPGMEDYAFFEGYPMRDFSSVMGGGILSGEAAEMGKGANVYLQVEDLAATEASIAQHGGRVIVSKMPVPETGHFSLFLDPDGNRVAIIEMSAAA